MKLDEQIEMVIREFQNLDLNDELAHDKFFHYHNRLTEICQPLLAAFKAKQEVDRIANGLVHHRTVSEGRHAEEMKRYRQQKLEWLHADLLKELPKLKASVTALVGDQKEVDIEW
jgi:hypothetical protein